MTSKNPAIFVVALVALAATPLTRASDTHNLVLIVPEALPAVGIEQGSAPALIRLRSEGVHFTNTHSGFPTLSRDEDGLVSSDLDAGSLTAAASREYGTVFIDDVRDPAGEVRAKLSEFLSNGLPRLKERGRPFVVVYRLAEPPPTGGAPRRTYKADSRAADAALTAIEESLQKLELSESTNIIVAAEHGLSRIVKVSNTSKARRILPREESLGVLPAGFLAVDLLAALQTEDSTYNLFDSTDGNATIAADYDSSNPLVWIESHGAYGTVRLADWLSKPERRATARLIVEAVLEQDYLGAVFVNEKRTGGVRGALPLTHIAAGINSDAPAPDIVVAFASVTDGCVQPITCTSVIADTPLEEGHGVPNSFNRAGTSVFLAARGPDFQHRVIDRAPVSNADVTRTIAELLSLEFEPVAQTKSRVLTESLTGERYRPVPKARKQVIDSAAAADGAVTRVTLQSLGAVTYFDSAASSNQERLALAVEPKREWHWPSWKRFTITLSDDDD